MAANPNAAESPTSTAECDHDEGLRGTGSLGRDIYRRLAVDDDELAVLRPIPSAILGFSSPIEPILVI
jgi:hypothetical protein